MRVQRPGVRAGVVLAALVLATGCTEPDPPPAPVEPAPAEEPEEAAPLGLSVGVVLPPGDALDPQVVARVQRDLEGLAAASGPEVRGVQVLVPPSSAFVGDLTALLADRGTQLVCVLGPGASEAASAEFALHPELDFCAAPVPTPDEAVAEVVGLEVRAVELGYTVGVAAALAADDGPIGLVLGSAELPSAPFRAGVQAAVGGRELAVAGGDDPLEGTEQVLAAGASVVVLDPAGDAGPALAALEAAGVPVLVPEALVGGRGGAPPVVLTWQVDWAGVVASAIASHLAASPSPPTSHGFAEGTLAVELGAAASAAVEAAVAAVVADLRSGTWDADVPPAGPADADAVGDADATGDG